ncbi:GNAT family N-acetyltransferase [Paenibacillus yanchengensis]|uniref:GNAT family N-acetyltransferase n=1 Tax=Paenibacillus yanchengensis TaxID=2035833 RepID=A0ABW4YEQ7_9BACL
MNIQQATMEDAVIIYQVMMAAFQQYKVENPPSSALKETVQSIESAMKNGEQALLVYNDNIPIAAVRYQLLDDELYFYRLSVIPESRGQGVAKRLLDRLEEVAKNNNITTLYCKVRMKVEKNLMLYGACGFVLCEQEVLTTVDGGSIDVGHMRKRL